MMCDDAGMRSQLPGEMSGEPPNNDCAIITTKREGIAHKIYRLALLEHVAAVHQLKGGEGVVWLSIPRMWEEHIDVVSSLLERQPTKSYFHGARGAETVADSRLG